MRIQLLKVANFALGQRFLATKTYKKVTHCIFDMDGLLLDTELVYKKMITQLCAQYGHKYTDELMMKILGGTEQRLSEILCKELNLPVAPTEFRDQLLKLGDTMLAGAPLLDGAERLIRHLHKTKVPFALATSSSERSVHTKVAKEKELFNLFHHKVMGSSDPEVKFGKPHPDIFLVAAARFPEKPDPSKCLVFEDSPHGVTAGIDAGMQVVMVPDPHLDKRLTKHATIVLPTLANFQPELFDYLWLDEDGRGQNKVVCLDVGLRPVVEQCGLVDGTPASISSYLFTGAERLIRHLHKTKVPFALATSSSERSVHTKVAKEKELFNLFHHKVMGSSDPEVKFGKPHPDIFLVAAARFPEKPDPSKCLVFEDSPHGVTAGIDAGMQVVMVPDPHLDKRLTKHATIVLPTLANFQPELFGLPAF